MARKPNPGSVAGLVRMLAEEGYTDVETVTHAVKEAQPTASEKKIRKALTNEIVRRSAGGEG